MNLDKIEPFILFIFVEDGETHGHNDANKKYLKVFKEKPYMLDKFVLSYFMSTFKVDDSFMVDNYLDVLNLLNKCLKAWTGQDYELDPIKALIPCKYSNVESYAVNKEQATLLRADLGHFAEKVPEVYKEIRKLQKVKEFQLGGDIN